MGQHSLADSAGTISLTNCPPLAATNISPLEAGSIPGSSGSFPPALKNLQDAPAQLRLLANDAATADDPNVLFISTHPVSPGISDCWLGAEVQVENISSRRCSYEEMVHEETKNLLNGGGNENFESSEPESNPGPSAWQAAVLKVTQWAITLQEIKDERRGMPNINSKCLCHKASGIGQKLEHLTKVMINCLENNENEDFQQQNDFDLIKLVNDVQSALRAGVSIQV